MNAGRGADGRDFAEPCPPHLVTPLFSRFHRDAALPMAGTSCSCAGSLTPHRGFDTVNGPVFTVAHRARAYLVFWRRSSRRVVVVVVVLVIVLVIVVSRSTRGHMRHETGLTRVLFVPSRKEARARDRSSRCRCSKDTRTHGGNIRVQVRGLAGCRLFVRPSAL